MKIALIAPIDNLDYTVQGDMHMALTHLVFKSEAYREFYALQKDKFLILDNGAFEGELNDIQSVFKAAEQIKADEIILPDILYDCEATISSTTNALNWIAQNDLMNKYRLMGVPQGKDRKEWWKCYHYMNAHPNIDTIGLSKLSCPKAYSASITTSRMIISKRMNDEKLFKRNKQYHLLGGSHQIFAEVVGHPSFIRSIDSSAPFEYGRLRRRLMSAGKDVEHKTDLEKGLPDDCLKAVEKNIKELMKEVQEHDHLSKTNSTDGSTKNA